MTPVLTTDRLSKDYDVRIREGWRRVPTQVHALTDVTIHVPKGGTLGIVGESGCGKSTLSRLLTRLEQPTAGSILLEGTDVTSASGTELREYHRRVQLVFQDPATALDPRFNVTDLIAEPFRIHRDIRVPGGYTQKVCELMELVGLNPDHRHRFPHEFSGGQRQRIGIARALALAPDVVVLDEPVSALDLSVQAQVINLLQDLQKELGVSYVFVAHDLSVVRHISDEVAVMYLGRVVESGQAEQVFTHPKHPYTRALLAAAPSRNRPLTSAPLLQGEPPSPLATPEGCPFRPRCEHATSLCSSEIPELRMAKGSDHLAACHNTEALPLPTFKE